MVVACSAHCKQFCDILIRPDASNGVAGEAQLDLLQT